MQDNLMSEVHSMMDSYFAWLKSETELKKAEGDWVEIETPHLDRHNDYMSVYLRRSGREKYELSDGGAILQDLEMSGFSIDTKPRKRILDEKLTAFGVRMEGGAICVNTSRLDFPTKKHSLIQAMAAVNDIFSAPASYTGTLFFEDVQNWLDDNDVRYLPNVKISGKSGYDHMFDFSIPHSRRAPDRFLQAISSPSKDIVSKTIFSWLDIQEARENSRLFIVLNDQKKKIPAGVLVAMENYELQHAGWNDIDTLREALVA